MMFGEGVSGLGRLRASGLCRGAEGEGLDYG